MVIGIAKYVFFSLSLLLTSPAFLLFNIPFVFLTIFFFSQLCNETKQFSIDNPNDPLPSSLQDHLELRQHQYCFYAYIRDWVRTQRTSPSAQPHPNNTIAVSTSDTPVAPRSSVAGLPTISNLLNLKPFVSPAPPTLSTVLAKYDIKKPTFPAPLQQFPADATMLITDFTTLNLYAPISISDKLLYATDCIIVQVNQDGNRYHHFLCDDALSRTGDFFYVREVYNSFCFDGPVLTFLV
jgi:hypothetical protein